jgi:hypothetical protein
MSVSGSGKLLLSLLRFICALERGLNELSGNWCKLNQLLVLVAKSVRFDADTFS